MRILVLISRIFTGLVFIFSGFVKAVDPMGSTYKFIDYFNAFHIGFLEPLALPLSVFLSSAELIIGFALLTGFRLRIASIALFVFMVFFTILTFILAIFNPVTDCGCFGDALILTNWQTFWKNVVLMAPTLFLFVKRKEFNFRFGKIYETASLLVVFLLTVWFSVWNYRHIPLLDFRPYKIGTNIPEAMIIPEGAPSDVYDTRLIYRNKLSGKDKEFTLEDFPRDTAEWIFVDAISTLVSRGYEPPIHNFSIIAPDRTDLTSMVLADEGFTFVLIAHSLSKANSDALVKAGDYYKLAQALPDVGFIALTASTSGLIDQVRDTLNLPYDFCLTDEITLKTIVRSNPGLLLLKKGTIVGKWGFRDFPDPEELPAFNRILSSYPFCISCEPALLNYAPAGSRPAEYQTTLFYLNLQTNETREFTMDNFPHNSSEWVFIKSVSVKSPKGFRSPLDPLVITSLSGMDYTDVVLGPTQTTLVLMFRNPLNLQPETWQAVNKLSGMAGLYLGGNAGVYGLVPLGTNEAMRFADENISVMEFLTVPAEAMEMTEFEEVFVFLIKDGVFAGSWKDKEVPEPEALAGISGSGLATPSAENVLLPTLLNEFREKLEVNRLYTLIILLTLAVFALTAPVFRKPSEG